jgi:hypothetical protein
MPRYAEKTTVTSDETRLEIERTLKRYQATAFGYGWEENRALIEFRLADRRIRFVLPLPPKAEFERTPERRLVRSPAEQEKAWEQACRQRWRALALVIKAKLEAIEAGVVSVEEEFLAHTVLPDGRTVGELAIPAVRHAYATGEFRPLLPGLEEPPRALPAAGGGQ